MLSVKTLTKSKEIRGASANHSKSRISTQTKDLTYIRTKQPDFALLCLVGINFWENGRGTRARTRDLRFWRPSLYQLSYTPTLGV